MRRWLPGNLQPSESELVLVRSGAQWAQVALGVAAAEGGAAQQLLPGLSGPGGGGGGGALRPSRHVAVVSYELAGKMPRELVGR